MCGAKRKGSEEDSKPNKGNLIFCSFFKLHTTSKKILNNLFATKSGQTLILVDNLFSSELLFLCQNFY